MSRTSLSLHGDVSHREVVAVLRTAVFGSPRTKCVHCGSRKVGWLPKEVRYYCKSCRKKFSLVSSTWLSGSKLSLVLVTVLLRFWLTGYSVQHTHEQLGLSIPTVRRYFRLFRLHVVKTLEFTAENNVQVDEAYFGQFRKIANYYHGQKTYQIKNKVMVAGIGCPATGQLVTKVITHPGPGKTGKLVRKFIQKHVPTNVRVFSDGSHLYTLLKKTHWHTPGTHDLGFHNAYFIEGCWGWMKRLLFRQYHHFNKKYAEEYIAELTFKFNIRRIPKNPLTFLANSFTAVP